MRYLEIEKIEPDKFREWKIGHKVQMIMKKVRGKDRKIKRVWG